MARSITLVQGDTAKAIVATLRNADGPQNLTGATVKLHLKQDGVDALSPGDSDIVDALGGVVSNPGSQRSAWVAGEYQAEYRVVYADSSVDIFPSEQLATIVVRARRT